MSRIFLNIINSPLGHEIYEEFRNDHLDSENFNKIFATIDSTDGTLNPAGPYGIIKFDRKKEYLQTLINCDLVVLDLHTGGLDKFEDILKALKASTPSTQKTVILILNVFTWGDTPPKTVINDEGLSLIEESKLEVSMEVVSISVDAKKVRKQIIPFEESEFQLRKAYPKYEIWKSIENLCISLNKQKNLNAYVQVLYMALEKSV